MLARHGEPCESWQEWCRSQVRRTAHWHWDTARPAVDVQWQAVRDRDGRREEWSDAWAHDDGQDERSSQAPRNASRP